MLDWLRYLPLAFRNSSYEKVQPKGPYFSKLRKRFWNLGDNKFHFCVPWSNPVFGPESLSTRVDNVSPGNDNILSYKPGPAYDGSLSRWCYRHFYTREWLFVDAWFRGMSSCLTLRAGLVQSNITNHFNGASFYHPRVFETVIVDYLNSNYGHHKRYRKPDYRGPLNWKVLPLSSRIQAVCLDIHDISDNMAENPKLERLVLFPIAQDKVLELSFDFLGARLCNEDVDTRPMFELMDSIIDTFRLEVGPDTQAQWEEVHKMCPDMSLTEEFGELKWPINAEDLDKVASAPEELSAIEYETRKLKS